MTILGGIQRPGSRRLGKMAFAGAITGLALSLTAAPQTAKAEDFNLFSGGGFANVPIMSLVERRFQRIVRQQYDYSCGSAALATLLSYHYGRPTTEQDAFTAMWAVGDKQRITQVGFSLAEMKAYLETIGYRADGFRFTLDRVEQLGIPGIALINVNGYKHFVVVKGLNDRIVVYGDPAAGMKTMARRDFEKIWADGIFFLIRSNVDEGKSGFNQVADWKVSPLAPVEEGGRFLREEPLSAQVLNRNTSPFNGEFAQTFSGVNLINTLIGPGN